MTNIIAALMVCIAIIAAGKGIEYTLDEVCPEPVEGIEFLNARAS